VTGREAGSPGAEGDARPKPPGGRKKDARAFRRGVRKAAPEPASEPAAAELAALRDRWLRCEADLENIRRRAEREKAAWLESANANLMRALLPALDDLERSLKMPDDADPAVFRSGIALILQKFTAALAGQGLAALEALGRPFDTELHEALRVVDAPGAAPGTVVEEYEKGFLLNGRVLRHARVGVSGGS
jgi:molecular chaperone GrpE